MVARCEDMASCAQRERIILVVVSTTERPIKAPSKVYINPLCMMSTNYHTTVVVKSTNEHTHTHTCDSYTQTPIAQQNVVRNEPRRSTKQEFELLKVHKACSGSITYTIYTLMYAWNL